MSRVTKAIIMSKTPPLFVRWTDHLTGKSCTLRVDGDDADAPLRLLVSKYLEASGPQGRWWRGVICWPMTLDRIRRSKTWR